MDAGGIDLNDQRYAVVHGDGHGLRPTHASQPGAQHGPPPQRTVEVRAGDGRKRLVRALQDALGTDVDPRAGGHLSIHGQAQRLQLPKLLPGGPRRHQHRVADQHPRGPLVRAEDSHRLSGLDEQRLVGFQGLQAADDSIKTRPVARGFAGTAIHDEFVRLFRDFRIQVIHQHPQCGFLRPAPAAELGAAWRPHPATRHCASPQIGIILGCPPAGSRIPRTRRSLLGLQPTGRIRETPRKVSGYIPTPTEAAPIGKPGKKFRDKSRSARPVLP